MTTCVSPTDRSMTRASPGVLMTSTSASGSCARGAVATVSGRWGACRFHQTPSGIRRAAATTAAASNRTRVQRPPRDHRAVIGDSGHHSRRQFLKHSLFVRQFRRGGLGRQKREQPRAVFRNPFVPAGRAGGDMFQPDPALAPVCFIPIYGGAKMFHGRFSGTRPG
jgi:hypothetical protein